MKYSLKYPTQGWEVYNQMIKFKSEQKVFECGGRGMKVCFIQGVDFMLAARIINYAYYDDVWEINFPRALLWLIEIDDHCFLVLEIKCKS